MVSSPLTDLAHRARVNGSRTFLVDDDIRLNYSESYHYILSVGTFLRSIDVRRGDRVGVLMGKGYRQVLAQMGIMAAGAVMVPISDLLKAEQVQHILRDCSIKAIFVDHDKMDRLGDFVRQLKLIEVGGKNADLERILSFGLVTLQPDVISVDNAAIIYTSGSTGMPKGIVLSHRNFWDGARIVTSYLGLGEDDRLAQVMSLNFDYGLNQIFSSIHVGAEVHFTSFNFPKDLFYFLEAREITTLALMPIFLNRLFDPRFFDPSFTKGIDKLRRITTSGGRVSKRIIDTVSAVFPATDFYLMYGLTEAFRSTYLPPEEILRRPNSIGRAIPDVQILVLDETGSECPHGEIGELVHRGGVVAKGYWNAPEKTAERFRPMQDASGNVEMVVYSGDLVRRDAEGFLYYVGRRDNQIKTSGHRVSPEEVERACEQFEGIQHAVVFGRENEVLGEEIVMVCILEKTAVDVPDLTDLKTHLRQRLAAYMIPQHIVFQYDFITTPGNQGKLDRASVKQLALKELENSA